MTHLEKKNLIHKPLGSFPQKGYLTLIFYKLCLEKVPECTFRNKVQYIIFFFNIDFILYRQASLPSQLSSRHFSWTLRTSGQSSTTFPNSDVM